MSASSSSESSDSDVRVSAMPPPPFVRSGVGGSCFRVTAMRLTAPVPLSLVLRVWVRVGSLRHAIDGPARFFTVVLPLLLRVLGVATGIFRFGLCSASSESSMAWRNWQV